MPTGPTFTSILKLLNEQSFEVLETALQMFTGNYRDSTGTLQGNGSAGISNLWGLHVYLQSL